MHENDGPWIAVVSDIHGNIDALEAVWEDMAGYAVEKVFCLGDIVGYGPEPAECVQSIINLCDASVLGNHEAMFSLSQQILEEDWEAAIGRPLQLANEQLNQDQRIWLANLPMSKKSGSKILCHASLHEPTEFHYIEDNNSATAHFSHQNTFVSFHGHTHVPVIWEYAQKKSECLLHWSSENPIKLKKQKRYAINCGSVGQPRDGDPRASYLLYNQADGIALHRRVAYDITRAVARFKKAGIPEDNSSRLLRGE